MDGWTASRDDRRTDKWLQAIIASNIDIPDAFQKRSSVGRLLTWFPSALYECYRYVQSVIGTEKHTPLVVVHGDTLSTFIGAIAGKLAGADVVHLESGLSSESLFDPFPEEILRCLTFKLTRYALCPSPKATVRMLRFKHCEVIDTGDNTLLDCVRLAVESNSWKEAGPGRYFVASIRTNAHVLRGLRGQARFDIAQAFEISQLSKCHDAEMFGARQRADSIVSVVARHNPMKGLPTEDNL